MKKLAGKQSFSCWLVVLFLSVGIGLRFYNLDWGKGFFFHPDERNIATAVAQISFPEQMNPNFFAYGSFPIYLNRLLIGSVSASKILPKSDLFQAAVMSGRWISALCSSLLIILVYWAGSRFFSQKTGTIAAMVTAFTPGLIQAAHFGTFESLLALEYLLILILALKLNKEDRFSNWVWLGLISGITIGTKITSILALGFYPVLLFKNYWYGKEKRNIKKLAEVGFISLLIILTVFLLTNPYAILDFPAFSHSIKIEAAIAQGTIPVFYTRQFIGSIPLLFQTIKVLPFILGPAAALMLPFSLIHALSRIRKKSEVNILLVLMIPGFLFNIFLFVKWARYMIPIVPCFLLMIGDLLSNLERSKFNKLGLKTVSWLVIGITLISGLAFVNIYAQTDTRITASEWLETHVPQQAVILSEAHDLGIISVSQSQRRNVKLFNFYELDSGTDSESQGFLLLPALAESDYILVLSSRVWKNVFQQPALFPNAYRFYRKLFAEELGFTKIKEFTVYPQIFNYFFNDSEAEETIRVFDHPTLMLYKKTDDCSVEKYRDLLTI